MNERAQKLGVVRIKYYRVFEPQRPERLVTPTKSSRYVGNFGGEEELNAKMSVGVEYKITDIILPFGLSFRVQLPAQD